MKNEKLTQVARASLEELKLDYEDFLRQRALPMLEPRHPVLMRFKGRQCRSLEEVQAWVVDERGKCREEHGHTDGQGLTRTNRDAWTGMDGEAGRKLGWSEGRELARRDVAGSTGSRSVSSTSLSSACLAANAALSLLNLACWLLDRQVERLGRDFENDGGFTERLYRVHCAKRREHR